MKDFFFDLLNNNYILFYRIAEIEVESATAKEKNHLLIEIVVDQIGTIDIAAHHDGKSFYFAIFHFEKA